jgi:hypothetical protein
MTDLLISLVVGCLCTVLIKRSFNDSGLGAFPVLTFLVVTLITYLITAAIEMIL